METIIADVYAEARKYVNFSERSTIGPVTAHHFQRYAMTVGDLNPIYFDKAVAMTAGYPDMVAPPTYLTSIFGWEPGPPEEQLNADGTTANDVAFINLQGARLMGAGQELESIRPVVDGALITRELTVEDVQLREGKSGSMVLIKLVKRYFDQFNQLLTVCRETFIVR